MKDMGSKPIHVTSLEFGHASEQKQEGTHALGLGVGTNFLTLQDGEDVDSWSIC